ncbi:ATP-binding protein [Pseudomonas sp. TH41]|uniref:ATP-binding protein n=1 Tax=Pseudomonas sp. TH41 TaxID=2796405 RepID=UPI001912B031|nr:ATP-binding protein [Pseudomonas sp. TH41]MBK5355050.1 ATP-binding protein [Pseudomonas sp. TH41]
MSIAGFENKTEFTKKLNEHMSASGPVKSIQQLFGREKELSLIEEALYANGRHVFIYGDRGVGKSSLAAAAAAQYQSSDNSPIQIGCGPDTKFYETIENLVDRVMKSLAGGYDHTITQTLNVKIYSISWKNSTKKVEVFKVDSMYSAVNATEEIAKYHSEQPVIIIDEFDQIESETERKLFATFLKDLGDRGVNVKFIFTGVATSLDKLLGSHESSFRQLHTIGLERLGWSAREDIVRDGAAAFSLTVGNDVCFTIAKISNGFPSYAHLIMEKLLWIAFNEDHPVSHLDMKLFEQALRDAISSIGAHLKRPYEQATAHRSPDYTEILWATSDSEDTIRYSESIFLSYIRIHEKIHGKNPPPEYLPLPQPNFLVKLRDLKKKPYGEIIENAMDRKGLYTYRENILRGFIAMKALEGGVELQGNIPDAPKIPTALAKAKRINSAGKDNSPQVRFRGEELSGED